MALRVLVAVVVIAYVVAMWGAAAWLLLTLASAEVGTPWP